MPLPVEDELAIIRLVNSYAHATSSRDVDGVCSLFTEDGVWERVVGAKTSQYTEQVRIEGAKAFREFSIMSFEMAGGVPYQYCSINPVITGDGNEAKGRVTLVIYGMEETATKVVMIGNFEDRYRKTADGWKFTYRGMHAST